jgi:Zn-dependent protease
MSEPKSPFPPTLEWEQPPAVWVIPPPRQRLWVHVVLLLATFLSTTVVGARMESHFLHRQPVFSLEDDLFSPFVTWIGHPSELLPGLPFSLTLMFILLAHEMGHYLYARHYRVYATLPFFIPFPIGFIGTLGAFIRIKSPIPSRAALFDIGIAGPIAGFIPACLALIAGLSLSRPLTGTEVPDIQLGFPLAFHLAALLLHITAPLSALSLHPIAAAAWVGMFATALNLLPGGQLDGGHVVFAVSPRLHRWVSMLTVFALIPFGFIWKGWVLWAVFLFMTARHPNVSPYPRVSGRRRGVALFGLLMLVLTFMPVPLAEHPRQDVWPGIRDSTRETLHSLRNKTRHLLHRH